MRSTHGECHARRPRSPCGASTSGHAPAPRAPPEQRLSTSALLPPRRRGAYGLRWGPAERRRRVRVRDRSGGAPTPPRRTGRAPPARSRPSRRRGRAGSRGRPRRRLEGGAVEELDGHPPAEHHADVQARAAGRAHLRGRVRRPAPARLVRDPQHRHAGEVDHVDGDAPAGQQAPLVGLVERVASPSEHRTSCILGRCEARASTGAAWS